MTASPPDATPTELLLEYEVLGTPGTLHYALAEADAAAQGGKVNTEQPQGDTCECLPTAQEPYLVLASTQSYFLFACFKMGGLKTGLGMAINLILTKAPLVANLTKVELSRVATVQTCDAAG